MPPPCRPGLAKCGSLPLRVALRDALRLWMLENGVSLRLLAQMTGRSLRRVVDYTTGHAPLPIEVFASMPAHHAASLKHALDGAVIAFRKSA